MTTTNNTQALLNERGRTHGDYAVHALITQDLKRVITHHVGHLDRRLDDDMQESLDMVAHKIGRIIAGDPLGSPTTGLTSPGTHSWLPIAWPSHDKRMGIPGQRQQLPLALAREQLWTKW
jgi:hypothetical protein